MIRVKHIATEMWAESDALVVVGAGHDHCGKLSLTNILIVRRTVAHLHILNFSGRLESSRLGF